MFRQPLKKLFISKMQVIVRKPKRYFEEDPSSLCDDKIKILQCLSYFYVINSITLSTIPLGLISDFTGLSMIRVFDIVSVLDSIGYLTLTSDMPVCRLDPLRWEEQSQNGRALTKYAEFVSNAPSFMRSRHAMEPQHQGCIISIDTSVHANACSTTIASTFDGIQGSTAKQDDLCMTYTNTEFDYARRNLIERAFIPLKDLDQTKRLSFNLWSLHSKYDNGEFFRLFQNALYLTSGILGMTLMSTLDTNLSPKVIFLINDANFNITDNMNDIQNFVIILEEFDTLPSRLPSVMQTLSNKFIVVDEEKQVMSLQDTRPSSTDEVSTTNARAYTFVGRLQNYNTYILELGQI